MKVATPKTMLTMRMVSIVAPGTWLTLFANSGICMSRGSDRLAPMQQNEPGLSSGLRLIGTLVETLHTEGMPPERIVLMGFSQGACLVQEFAACKARRFAAVAGLSGGLIGPPGTPRKYSGSFEGTPVFLGCSDIDPHIPVERVHESVEVFRKMGAEVDERIYPGMGHTVNQDEIDAVGALLRA